MRLVQSQESESLEELIRHHIRVVPDFPKKGVLFQDITTLLQSPGGFFRVVEGLAQSLEDTPCDCIVAIEARGFILGGALAHRMGLGFVPLRKAGKLPWRAFRQEYDLEYGSEALEMHIDGIPEGAHVVVVDDLLATGGTMEAAFKLILLSGGKIAGARFLIELAQLGGRQRLAQMDLPDKLDLAALCRIGGEAQ